MKKYIFLIIISVLLFIPLEAKAQRGCCSHHGGVAGCDSSGKQICRDGTLSPTCTCAPKTTTKKYVYGCTDKEAKNYNSSANKDDNSCEYYVYGCTDSFAENYNVDAEIDDGSCEYKMEEENNKIETEKLKLNNTNDNSSYEAINLSDNDDDANEDSGALGILVFVAGAGALGTYLYKKKKKG